MTVVILCADVLVNTNVLCACLHRFCEGCIHAWFRTSGSCSCPVCHTKSPPYGCLPDVLFEQLLVAVLGRRVDDRGGSSSGVGMQVPAAAEDRGLKRKFTVQNGVSFSHHEKSIKRGLSYSEACGASMADQADLQPAPLLMLRTLRPPGTIVKIYNTTGSGRSGKHSLWKVRYIACPLKRTILELKMAIGTGLAQAGKGTRVLGQREIETRDIVVRMNNQVPYNAKCKVEDDMGLRDTVCVGDLLSMLGDCNEDLELQLE